MVPQVCPSTTITPRGSLKQTAGPHPRTWSHLGGGQAPICPVTSQVRPAFANRCRRTSLGGKWLSVGLKPRVQSSTDWATRHPPLFDGNLNDFQFLALTYVSLCIHPPARGINESGGSCTFQLYYRASKSLQNGFTNFFCSRHQHQRAPIPPHSWPHVVLLIFANLVAIKCYLVLIYILLITGEAEHLLMN